MISVSEGLERQKPSDDNKKDPQDGGAKRFDTGVRLDLLVPEFLVEMAKIMCVGAKKYGELNWKKGGLTGEKGGVNHALHHLLQYMADEPCDYGPRETHLAQVAVNAMFEFWYARQVK